MKKYLLGVVLLIMALPNLRADDQLRSAQVALKEQGYFFGEPDGQPGPETSAAIRRFQIRSGVAVTGTLTPETVTALNGESGEGRPPARPESDVRPPASVVANDQDFLESNRRREPEPDSRVVAPAGDRYADVFASTPYENAPPEVQRTTLRRAQSKLARSGYYRGEPDGVPGPGTARALADYQVDKGLDSTGRLDMRTLSALDLLPVVRQISKPPVRPALPPPSRPVYRGIWVR